MLPGIICEIDFLISPPQWVLSELTSTLKINLQVFKQWKKRTTKTQHYGSYTKDINGVEQTQYEHLSVLFYFVITI